MPLANEQSLANRRTHQSIHAVIVHHHGREMLGTCLHTLLASQNVELQVIVVANACDEELPDIADEHPQVHVVRTPESIGFSAANNLGVSFAERQFGKADFFYFLNNDTESEPNTLGLLVDALLSEPQAAIAGPQTLIQAAPDHLNSLGINVTEDAWGWDEGIGIALAEYGELPGTREVLAVTGSALLVQAEAFAKVGGWTEVYQWYFEDIDLGVKAWKRGYRVLNVPESIIYHRVSATMTVGAERKYFFFWRNRLMLAFMHWPLGLLMRLLRHALWQEIWKAGWRHSGLQRRALGSALRRLPRMLVQRFRFRGNTDWLRFLKPTGSVPVITLPAAVTEAAAQEAAAQEEAAQEAAVPDDAEAPARWQGAAQLAPAKSAGRRLLILGWSPLPFENERMNYAPGGRSWQMAQPLAADGHAVCLVCARIPGAYFDDDAARPPEDRDGVLIYRLSRDEFEQPGTLEQLVAAFRPDAILGAAPVPSRRAVQLAGELPVWVDLFGDPMAEAQAKAEQHSAGDHLSAYWQLMAEVLSRGDAFAAVSGRQRHAVIGQLGLAGRLNGATAGHELVHVLPVAVEAAEPKTQETTAKETKAKSIETLVLWSGGFNTWCDPQTLIEGLELAMDQRPEIRFAATGGAIDDHDQATWEQIQQLVADSRHQERMNLLGCLPQDEAEQWLKRASLAIVTERPLYERELGSSGRLLNWLGRGLPLLCTAQSELGMLVQQEKLGLTYPTGDAAALSERILEIAGHPNRAKALANNAYKYASQKLDAASTTEPLRSWCLTPERAPDAAGGHHVPLLADLQTKATELLAAEQQIVSERQKYDQVRAELGDIHHSKMWSLWMSYLNTRRFLRRLLPF